MPRDTLMDLTDHIFAEIERLSDDDLTGDELRDEVKRAAAIGSLSKTAIDAGHLMISSARFQEERIAPDAKLPRLLGGDDGR